VKTFTIALILTTLLAGPALAQLNDTCATAIDITDVWGPGYSLVGSTCNAENDYDAGEWTCLYFGSPGRDIVYQVGLTAGEQFVVTATTGYDNSLYLITDCNDPEDSCVAGADEGVNGVETLDFTVTETGVYYLILDGFVYTSCDDVTLTFAGIVAAETSSWGAAKAMYR